MYFFSGAHYWTSVLQQLSCLYPLEQRGQSTMFLAATLIRLNFSYLDTKNVSLIDGGSLLSPDLSFTNISGIFRLLT